MIVLPRKQGESFLIGDDIEVFVVEIRGDKVRLGINHPRDVPVHRKEVFDALQRNRLNVGDSDTQEVRRKKIELLEYAREKIARARSLDELSELEKKFR